MTAPPVTDDQLRAAGHTASARRYPLSPGAARILCFMNGIKFDAMPLAWWFAPNEAVQRQMEALTKSPVAAVAWGLT